MPKPNPLHDAARVKPVLFTPGPVQLPKSVADSLANPPVNYHRQAGFQTMFASNEADLKKLVGIRFPEAYFAVQMTSTGTGANEAAMLAMAGLGRGVVVNNGYFGARAATQARQARLDHVVIEMLTDRPIDCDELGKQIDALGDIRWMFFVSHETRLGLVNPLVEIGQLAAERDIIVTADVISSSYAYPLDLEEARIDFAVASSAKALMAAPGIGIIIVRVEAIEQLRSHPARSFYFDLVAEYDKQSRESQPRFAQPVALHASIRAACDNLNDLGIDQHMARIQRQGREIEEALAAVGVRPLMTENTSGVVCNYGLPSRLRYPQFAEAMLERGFYLLYGIPGDESHFQVSTIGSLSDENVSALIAGLADVLGQ